MSSRPVSKLYAPFLFIGIAALLAAVPDPARAMPGDIYVTRCCGDLNGIDRVTPDGSVTVFASGSSMPFDPTFDSAGNLFVTNYSNNTIDKYASNGVRTIFASAGPDMPTGLAFDATGNLFAGYSNNTIKRLSPNGTGTVFASTGLNNPQGLAFDASGNLFVANAGNNTIEKFTSSGVASEFAGSVFSDPNFNNPYALAFDASGNLFVGNFVTTIVQFTPSGTESPFATVNAEVEGLAFDSAGNLLVANGGGDSLLAIAPNGDQRTIVDGLSVATGLAIEPASVPEPSTALIIATAFAGLRLTRRQRRGWRPVCHDATPR
jgi:hypothetical protein